MTRLIMQSSTSRGTGGGQIIPIDCSGGQFNIVVDVDGRFMLRSPLLIIADWLAARHSQVKIIMTVELFRNGIASHGPALTGFLPPPQTISGSMVPAQHANQP